MAGFFARLKEGLSRSTQKLSTGLTGTFTDLSGGKNLGITAGADLTFLAFRLSGPCVGGRSVADPHVRSIVSRGGVDPDRRIRPVGPGPSWKRPPTSRTPTTWPR